MKKEFLGVFAASLFLTTSAHALNFNYLPYVGADYSYDTAKVESLKPNYNVAGINVGTKYNDYFGTELFFNQSGSDSKKMTDGKYKSSFRAYGLDLSAYLPLGCYHEFDLFVTGGIGEYVFNQKFDHEKHHNDTGIGYRLGGGIMFNLNENWSLRTMIRHVELDKISHYDHLTEYSLGVRYHFNKE